MTAGPVADRGAAPSRGVGRPRDEQVDVLVRQTTAELLAETGFAALSIEAVAARSGVAKSTIYRRWTSKDELVFDALADLKGPLSIPPGHDVVDDLRFVLQAMRGQWSDGLHGRLMRRLALDGSDNPEHYRSFRERLIAPRQAVLRAIVTRAVAEGLIDERYEVEEVLRLLVAPIIAAGSTHQPRMTAAQVDEYVDILLRGLAPR